MSLRQVPVMSGAFLNQFQADFRKLAHTVHKLEKHPQEVKPNLNLNLPFNFTYELNKFQLTSQISPPTP